MKSKQTKGPDMIRGAPSAGPDYKTLAPSAIYNGGMLQQAAATRERCNALQNTNRENERRI